MLVLKRKIVKIKIKIVKIKMIKIKIKKKMIKKKVRQPILTKLTLMQINLKLMLNLKKIWKLKIQHLNQKRLKNK